MDHDDLDRLLSHEPEIVPSSGFTASVMKAVRVQAQAPPPIPFPWKRALPGIAAAVLSLAWIVFACVVACRTVEEPLLWSASRLQFSPCGTPRAGC